MTQAEIERDLDIAIALLNAAKAKAGGITLGSNEFSKVRRVVNEVRQFHRWATRFLDDPRPQPVPEDAAGPPVSSYDGSPPELVK